MQRSIGFAASLAVLFGPPAWGWHHQTAHRAINESAVKLFVRNLGSRPKYARSPWVTGHQCTGVGVTEPGSKSITEGDLTFSTSVWIREGGYYADEPEWTMALRHFYDPFSASGVTYLTDTIPDWYGLGNPNVDAKTWALNQPDNEDHWQSALQNYRSAMENAASDRNRSLARAFRGLGETLHLVADMTQPAHVRNDSHPKTEPVEDTVRLASVSDYGLNSPDPAVSITGETLEALFDNLAKFTNTRFYSSDTVYDAPSGVLPANDETPNALPQFSDMILRDATYHATFSVGEIPMVQETLTGYIRRKWGDPPDLYSWHVPAAFADAQASVLIPLATNAGAAIIDMFFPTIDLEMTLSSAPNGQITVEGQMIHRIEEDPEWAKLNQGAIKYNGSGKLMRSDGKKLADVYFTAGTMEPVTVSVQDEGDDSQYEIYLEVDAGARQFKSEPAQPPEEPEADFPRTYVATGTRTLTVEGEFAGEALVNVQRIEVQITLRENGEVSGSISSPDGEATEVPVIGGGTATVIENSISAKTTCPENASNNAGQTVTVVKFTFGSVGWKGHWYQDGAYDMKFQSSYYDWTISGRFSDGGISGNLTWPDAQESPAGYESSSFVCSRYESTAHSRIEWTFTSQRSTDTGD